MSAVWRHHVFNAILSRKISNVENRGEHGGDEVLEPAGGFASGKTEESEPMKTFIKPVDASMGIFRVTICCVTADGHNTWHRYRGSLSGCVAFCELYGCDYQVID